MSEETIDQQARDLAKEAAHGNELIGQRLDAHLEDCSRRYKESDESRRTLVSDIKQGFSDQRQATTRIHRRFDGLLRAVILGMGTIIVLGAGVIGTMLWYVITKG